MTSEYRMTTSHDILIEDGARELMNYLVVNDYPGFHRAIASMIDAGLDREMVADMALMAREWLTILVRLAVVIDDTAR